MMIKIRNLTQTHEVDESLDLSHTFSSRRLVALRPERKGVNQGLNGRDAAGLFMSGACLSRSRISGVVAFKKFIEGGGWFSDKRLRRKIMVEIFTIY